MGSNGNKTYIEIDLDGKTYQLKFDFNAFAELENILNIKGFGQLQTSLVDCGCTEIRAFLWTGLLHGKPELTISQVGALLDMKNISEYLEKITEAIVLATGSEGDDEDAPEQGEAEASTETKKT